MKTIKELMGLDEAEKMKGEDPCWAGYEMVGMKMKNGRKVPNCVPKAKNEEVELGEELDFKKEASKHMKDVNSPNATQAGKQYAAKMVRRALEASRMKDKEAAHNHYMGKEDVKEETEQIDELNKDTVYSYNKKADADIEKKHKSLGQLMRKGDAAGANKAAHQLNKRVAGMERAEKRLNKEEVEIEETKKTTPNAKPVDPKNLVVSLKDVPVKKPRGHTQYDPSKEFPGVKALKREETELEEAQFWGNKKMAKQANAASGSTTTMRGRDAKGVYTATLVRKKGESEHKEVSRVYDTKEEVEPIDEVSKELANRISTARRKQADDSSKKDPYLKPSAETMAKKKKADNAHASWIKRMHRDNNRGKTQADISREHAAAADYNSKRGWTNEELELEEAEEVKKAKMTPQERAYKRKLGLKAVMKPVEEAKVETAAQVTKHFEKGQSTPSGVPKWVAEPVDNPKLADKFMKAFRKMKTAANISCKTYGTVSTCEETELDEAAKEKKKGDPSQSKNVKKGEPLSGKQEPVKLNPELQEK